MRKCIANTYEIVARIGSGNSGIVYKAYHKNLNKYVVLKKVKEDIKDLVNARAEVDVLKNLKHPYLPLVENFVEDDGGIYPRKFFSAISGCRDVFSGELCYHLDQADRIYTGLPS